MTESARAEKAARDRKARAEPPRYLNTDLDLISDVDSTALAKHFEASGMFDLHAGLHPDGKWRAGFEMGCNTVDPEKAIGAFLNIIERLDPVLVKEWRRCSLREFNIGYMSGRGSRVLLQNLSPEVLRRIADVGASVGFTIYPVEKTNVS